MAVKEKLWKEYVKKFTLTLKNVYIGMCLSFIYLFFKEEYIISVKIYFAGITQMTSAGRDKLIRLLKNE